MRIVTFNIHHGTVGSKGRVDPARLGATCASFGADVLALQEVDVGTLRVRCADLAAEVARACGMVHVFGPSRRFLGGHYGNALLVRGEVRRWAVVPLQRFPEEPRGREQRTVLAADVVVDGRPLAVLATHLAVPPSMNGPQLDAVLDLAGRHAAPAVVLGDLNRPMDLVTQEAAARGLACVPHGPTFPTRRLRRSIDHVLVTAGLSVGSVDVRATGMSDHAALVVDVSLDR